MKIFMFTHLLIINNLLLKLIQGSHALKYITKSVFHQGDSLMNFISFKNKV